MLQTFRFLLLDKWQVVTEDGAEFTLKALASFLFFRISLTLSCPMNLKLYPLDRQICSLRMASCEYRMGLEFVHLYLLNLVDFRRLDD